MAEAASGAAAPREVVFFWDFFGPRAEGTARHFQHHLDELLAREAVAGAETAVEAPARAQWTVRCALPVAQAERLRASLRPRREEPR